MTKPKARGPIENLKLKKGTLKNLSVTEAASIKGGTSYYVSTAVVAGIGRFGKQILPGLFK